MKMRFYNYKKIIKYFFFQIYNIMIKIINYITNLKYINKQINNKL